MIVFFFESSAEIFFSWYSNSIATIVAGRQSLQIRQKKYVALSHMLILLLLFLSCFCTLFSGTATNLLCRINVSACWHVGSIHLACASFTRKLEKKHNAKRHRVVYSYPKENQVWPILGFNFLPNNEEKKNVLSTYRWETCSMNEIER